MDSASTQGHELDTVFEQVADAAPRQLDLTSDSHMEQAHAGADRLLSASSSVDTLQQLERDTARVAADAPMLAHLAVKLALSKALLKCRTEPTNMSIVFAMYKEHQRMLPQQDHPHGEDFLRRKAAQLDWLTRGNSCATWRMYAVDDGCPQGSGKAAAEIVRSAGLGDRIEVLWLDEAIRQGEAVTRPMTSSVDSQKGGSIQYGMWHAAQDMSPDNVVIYTDADLSTHLGQAGRLACEVLDGGAGAAVGSRREATSVVLKQGTRNTRGKLFIYLWKRLLPELGDLVDTQCGFKAFSSETAGQIVQNTVEKRFAFDIELLLRVAQAPKHTITRVPIAWIDSEAASTTTDLQPYLSMLKSTVRLYRTYLSPTDAAEPFARLIEGLDEAAWRRLVSSVPVEIADADPQTFGDCAPISPADLARRAGEAPTG